MTKKELRTLYKTNRSILSPRDLDRYDDLILINFQQCSTGNASVFLSYQPIPEKFEVNAHLLVDFLRFRIPGLRLAYPVIDPVANTFKAIEVDDETEYQLNHYGITEPLHGEELDPEEIDAAIIPLLAFDERGYRVGYGKGFYDRFLRTCKSDILKIGLSYFDAVPVIDDINEYDVPLNICVTPNRLYEF